MSTRNSKNFNFFLMAQKDSAISDRVLTCDYYVLFIAPALPITGQKRCARCVFACVVALIVSIIWCLRVMNFDWFVDVAHLIGMSKDKVDVICPACMPGDNFGIKSTLTQNAL